MKQIFSISVLLMVSECISVYSAALAVLVYDPGLTWKLFWFAIFHVAQRSDLCLQEQGHMGAAVPEDFPLNAMKYKYSTSTLTPCT